jgi:hypothetical protein
MSRIRYVSRSAIVTIALAAKQPTALSTSSTGSGQAAAPKTAPAATVFHRSDLWRVEAG